MGEWANERISNRTGSASDPMREHSTFFTSIVTAQPVILSEAKNPVLAAVHLLPGEILRRFAPQNDVSAGGLGSYLPLRSCYLVSILNIIGNPSQDAHEKGQNGKEKAIDE